jgi:transposase-like protein
MNEHREQNLAKWRSLVAEQEQSGQSVAAFCQTRELVQSQLIYWKRRLREVGRASFVEVQLARPSMEARVRARTLSCPGIEVRLKNGRSLMVGGGFDAHHLRTLLAVVESC